ncbi:cellulose synthase operon protein YhjU [Acidovorax sp. 69]|uniref:cellulose biosynthesis protein BcsG n=1 Tax=Acidovorax sp. 69 TaxID=2035202 RepID=UPI000C237AA8|nr:cellulose biosynthesis protein BcsG [Acidovorax sp. 69]PJI96694.1 cellulose synthase operon protein YhjU [Acidovorax sp. 69]
MRYWNLYFLAKVGLTFTGYIGFHWWLNLLLWLALLPPIAHKTLRRTRAVLAWPAAMALLYYDSYLPTLARVVSQLKALAGFSADYWLELATRLVSPAALVTAIAGIVVYAALARRVRFATFALAGILSVPLVAAIQQSDADDALAGQGNGTQAVGADASDPDASLQKFYASESQKRMQFTSAGGPPAFDIILLHVCSLSWDDMEFVGQRDNALLQRFDVLFTNFNSAASYSGPASLRVLHGSCGQTPHTKLYEGIDPQCYVFPNLEKLGYQTAGLMNHDGVYEEFAHTLEQRGGLAGKLQRNQDAPVHMQNFDGSPIYNDHALLSQWWKKHSSERGAAPMALYYNTISLHDGNRVPGMSSRNSLDTYKPRLVQLLADFDKFISELEASGRPVVVVLVPEHGASLRADKIQISGMREIPGPRITLVPAAVKLVGLKKVPEAPPTAPLVVNQPMSYLGLFTLLGDLLNDSPYAASARPLTERLQTPKTTPFVSENADVVVMRNAAGRYVMKSGNGEWIPYNY